MYIDLSLDPGFFDNLSNTDRPRCVILDVALRLPPLTRIAVQTCSHELCLSCTPECLNYYTADRARQGRESRSSPAFDHGLCSRLSGPVRTRRVLHSRTLEVLL